VLWEENIVITMENLIEIGDCSRIN